MYPNVLAGGVHPGLVLADEHGGGANLVQVRVEGALRGHSLLAKSAGIFEQAAADFIAQYGQETWDRQMRRGLRRGGCVFGPGRNLDREDIQPRVARGRRLWDGIARPARW